MEIFQLVSSLLYEHNCVIIPRFGGFIANTKNSSVDLQKNILKPVRKQVVFNASLTENDGLLVTALAKRKSIAYEDAELEVAKFVDFMVSRIDRYKNYEFKQVGSFYLNAEKNIIFVPYDGELFERKSYGLPTLKIRPLILEDKKRKEEKPKVVSINSQASKRTNSIKWANMAAAILVMAFAIGFAWKTIINPMANPDHNSVQSNQAGMFTEPPTEKASSPSIPVTKSSTDANHFEEDTLTQTLEPVVDIIPESDSLDETTVKNIPLTDTSDIPEKISIVSEPKKILSAEKKQETIFYIILGSDMEVSKSRIKKMERRAYIPFVTKDAASNTNFICLEKFTNQDRAREYLAIVKRYDDNNARILEL